MTGMLVNELKTQAYSLGGGQKRSCPLCGATGDFLTDGKVLVTYTTPEVVLITTEQVIVRCSQCGESGDFENKNDAVITEAFAKAKPRIIQALLDVLNTKHGYSYGYSPVLIERVFGLKIGHFNTPENCTESDIALLRILNYAPKLLHEADESEQFKITVERKYALTLQQKQRLSEWTEPIITTTSFCGKCKHPFSSGYLKVCEKDPLWFCEQESRTPEVMPPRKMTDEELQKQYGFTRADVVKEALQEVTAEFEK